MSPRSRPLLALLAAAGLTVVRIEGATKPGTLAYNSWLAMQKAGEKDAETCKFNDLALVGEALGVVGTLAFPGKPGSNGVGDMAKELAYARAHGFPDLELARGTEKFRPSLLGLS